MRSDERQRLFADEQFWLHLLTVFGPTSGRGAGVRIKRLFSVLHRLLTWS
jgi:hypothetical protein